jgi:hypothetical protein
MTTAASSRWQGDQRGTGVASGTWIAGHVAELQSALALPTWISEAPDAHVLPSIQRACAAPGCVWRLVRALVRGEVFEVELDWIGEDPDPVQVRQAIYALIGGFAESTTFVRQTRVEGTLEFHVATGSVGNDTRFAPHGHQIRFLVNLS